MKVFIISVVIFSFSFSLSREYILNNSKLMDDGIWISSNIASSVLTILLRADLKNELISKYKSQKIVFKNIVKFKNKIEYINIDLSNIKEKRYKSQIANHKKKNIINIVVFSLSFLAAGVLIGVLVV